ncbi:hypothetical protein CISG_06306 [Coccidioides immitis RMSCC 3703]|uniref:Uncharacterized protein n=1 Tax=Coccidioides immitis RMSCC 3703 TaxID=454286 RepID=A0A0J8QXC7_COCIT|nr:hypothetical protein CISG_06306 [Coccidioides immitis RMSCC 3703]
MTLDILAQVVFKSSVIFSVVEHARFVLHQPLSGLIIICPLRSSFHLKIIRGPSLFSTLTERDRHCLTESRSMAIRNTIPRQKNFIGHSEEAEILILTMQLQRQLNSTPVELPVPMARLKTLA